MVIDTIPVQIGWGEVYSTFQVEIECPNVNEGCSSTHVVKRGHDTKLKENPRHYECMECNRHFYAHTSGFFARLERALNERLFSVLKKGHLDHALLGELLGSSPSTISNLVRYIVEKVARSPKTEIFWKSFMRSSVLFIDETFLKIMKKTWYLIVLLNEQGNVLTFELVKKRTTAKIVELVKRAHQRMGTHARILVTDDFSIYKGVVMELKRDIIHVRHVHEPPYGRMIVDVLKREEKQVKVIHVATTNDILLKSNTFLVRYSVSVKNLHEKGKRGRPRGSKNRPKSVIAAEKREKKKQEGKKKKGPKDPFKDAETHVYHYNSKKGSFRPIGGSDKQVVESLRVLLWYFQNKHVTTNPVENIFSVLKKLIDFRGNRDVKYWKLLIRYLFTVREYPKILKDVLEEMNFSPQIIHKASYSFRI